MAIAGVLPDNYTFPCVLKACSVWKHLMVGLEVHCKAVKSGLDRNLFVGNALITLYSKCHRLDYARWVFDGMGIWKDVVAWNAMIAGYAQNGKFHLAMGLCEEMVESKKMKPDDGTMASVLPAMIKNDRNGNIDLIRRMFDEMPDKGLISWNAMIAICVGNGLAAEAVELFTKMMVSDKIKPDVVTIASILPACGDLSALLLGTRIHKEYRSIIAGNLVLENALIDMYSKCGCLKSAEEVFGSMKSKDVISWTSMISGHGMSGHGESAMKLFGQMVESGLRPDHIAFVSILSACSHSGLLEQGRRYFKSMIENHHITPTIEHLSCMVDLLGRSGNLEEALSFIHEMQIDPNERVWGTLLSCCRVYSNTKVGLIAADELTKLVPEQPGYFVLLSNVYAKAGRWADVASVRRTMKDKGLKKTPGCSNVEYDNKVHKFVAGDTSHPQSKAIYAELEVLLGRIKEEGYVAEVECALHDVEEEDKEAHLAYHSEKLAVAFALTNTPPRTIIRVTKNLRVCNDCHTALKFISKVTDRVIFVRDLNRFHRFASGTCSCADYW